MKASFFIIAIVAIVLLATGFIANKGDRYQLSPAISYGQAAADAFLESTIILTTACRQLDTSRASLSKAKMALAQCRVRYKKFSFLLDGYFPAQAKLYNAPAKFEVEEPFQEFERPQGLQQLEALLYGTNPVSIKDTVLQELTVIRESAQTLYALLATAQPTDQSLLECMHEEVLRIVCLYIAGYDAPLLRSGIQESLASLEGIRTVLPNLTSKNQTRVHLLQVQLDASIQYLRAHPEFLSFNRLFFVRHMGFPLDLTFQTLVNERKDSTDILVNFFYPRFRHRSSSRRQPLIQLGEKLFHEQRLSGNQLRSCASCHEPGKYFTDGMVRNLSADQKHLLPRNTPTLLYAALQSSQFWDGRSASLEAQLHTVLSSTEEMNASDTIILARLSTNQKYLRLFSNAFGETKQVKVTMNGIAAALIAYLETLSPVNSPFDRYIQGEDRAMTAGAQAGFNLFMGKAQCGTCHFLPVFNGSTPPGFNRSEFEVLGVPGNIDPAHPIPDKDPGRYDFFQTPLYLHAFKTPTLRNCAKTAPYMHNGVFSTLGQVLDFYNAGGGVGMGLCIPNQTLPADSLHLTKTEEQHIVQFLEALNDSLMPSKSIAPYAR